MEKSSYIIFCVIFGGSGNGSEVRGGRMKKFIINFFGQQYFDHFDMDVFETSCTSCLHAHKDVHEEISYFIR